jgi:hypothetical protein
MSDHQGSCYCGSVKVTIIGQEPPAAAGYCHCLSCRKWHAAPINAWAIWPADKVAVSGDVVVSEVDEASRRISCAKCGGSVANEKPQVNMTVVYAMSLAESDFQIEPGTHLCYTERAMDVDDGLSKFVDFPEDFGGSGTTVNEKVPTGWCA